MKLIILACSIAVAFAVNHGHHGNNHGHHHDHPNGNVQCNSDSDCKGCMNGTTHVCMTDGLCKCLQHVPVVVRQAHPSCTTDTDCAGTLTCDHGVYCHTDHGHHQHTGHCQCHHHEGDKVFLSVNGKKVFDYNGDDLGPIEKAVYGRNQDEIWFKFEGRSTGKRQLRSNFEVTTEFSKKFEKAATENNKAFLEVMAENGLASIGCKKPITPGYYEISCELLVHPPEDYKLRDVKDVWVEKIKEAMSLYPSKPLTRIPVLVRPEEVSDVQAFKEADLSNKTLWCLGGNHMLSAVKQLVAEDEQKYEYLRNIDVEIYVGLTKEEALEVSTIHNQQQEKLETTFQEKVMVARKAREIRREDWKDKATELLQIINHKNYKKQNLSMVLSVASYSPDNFKTVIDLFNEYEEKEGPQRSYPQNLFRSLQGQKDDTISHYLNKAKGTNGIKLARAVMENKQQETMKTVFMKEVGLSDWEEANSKFPVATKRVLELTDLKMRGEYIPKTLLELINAAKDGRDWDEGIFNISVKVLLNDKNITNIDFVEHIKDKYIQKMLLDLEKGRKYIKNASDQ